MGPTAELYASTHRVFSVSLVYALQAISLALFAMAGASSASFLGCAVPAVVAAGIGLAVRSSCRCSSLQPHMQTCLVTDALRMAWFRRQPKPGLIVHGDRGSQDCSDDFQAALKGYAMASSMSRKGNCWDNAPTVSLWSILKVGRLYGGRFATHREAMDEVIDLLTLYNHRRLQSTLGYISPMKFEANWHAGQVGEAA